MPRALITGITGQDGRHLAELLHEQGYDVVGMSKGRSNPRLDAVLAESPFLRVVEGDLADAPSLLRAVEQVEPDEVYNLAAISHVSASFRDAALTADITGLGPLRLLEAIRMVGGTDRNPIRFFQASSAEMFGAAAETPQRETTPFRPRSPYGCAKVLAHHLTVHYREQHGVFACAGILYNHEGPRRGADFVTRKVTRAAARISLGLQDELVLGTLDARRDWGYAGDYVRAMWLMLQADTPDDYVVATGRTHSIGDLVERAFAAVGIDDWRRHVRQDPAFFRPSEPAPPTGDPGKARRVLGWEPTVGFDELISMMVRADLAEAALET